MAGCRKRRLNQAQSVLCLLFFNASHFDFLVVFFPRGCQYMQCNQSYWEDSLNANLQRDDGDVKSLLTHSFFQATSDRSVIICDCRFTLRAACVVCDVGGLAVSMVAMAMTTQGRPTTIHGHDAVSASVHPSCVNGTRRPVTRHYRCQQTALSMNDFLQRQSVSLNSIARKLDAIIRSLEVSTSNIIDRQAFQHARLYGNK